MSTTPRGATMERHPAQWLALAIGAIYTLVGIAGFFITGFDGFVDAEGEMLLGAFEVNPLHNLVHLAIGVAGLLMWQRTDSARYYGWLLLVVYGAAFVYGLFVSGGTGAANFLAINAADNWLHAVTAAVGVALALWPARRAMPGRMAGAGA